jgi:hypothetical protein
VQCDARQDAAADVIDHDDEKNQTTEEIKLDKTGLRFLHYVAKTTSCSPAQSGALDAQGVL